MVSVSVTTFGNGLSQEVKELKELTHDTFTKTVEIVANAVINGSPILGIPGQPHDLRGDKWDTTFEGDWTAVIQTNDKSARSVEDGISYKYGKRLTKLKSPVGGFHSVALAEMNFDKILYLAAARVEAGVND